MFKVRGFNQTEKRTKVKKGGELRVHQNYLNKLEISSILRHLNLSWTEEERVILRLKECLIQAVIFKPVFLAIVL